LPKTVEEALSLASTCTRYFPDTPFNILNQNSLLRRIHYQRENH
jgi:hypothetical protein